MRNLQKFAIVFTLSLPLATCAAEKTAGERVDDTWVHTKVKSELLAHGWTNVNIEVYQGVVQLAGFVNTDGRRRTMEKVASEVTGVKRVSNQLVVQPETRTTGRTLDDGVIAGKVKSSLTDDKRTSGRRINVEVRFGEVLLSGFVTSEAEREAAAEVARLVGGVTKVINGIDIATPST